MHLGPQCCSLLKGLEIFLNHHASFGVQRAGRIRINQQATYCDEDVPQSQLRLPISLERLDTYCTSCWVYVGMEDFRSEVRCWRRLRIIFRNIELELE